MIDLKQDQLETIITTGYGRNLVSFGHKNLTEISCHARGANYLFPEVRTVIVIDIGGQDSKVISLDSKGRVTTFNMNDKCAAGTGRLASQHLKIGRWKITQIILQSPNLNRILESVPFFLKKRSQFLLIFLHPTINTAFLEDFYCFAHIFLGFCLVAFFSSK